MFIKRKEWGAVSWKHMGHWGALKKETMAKEMSVLHTHYFSVNNESHECWALNERITGFNSVLITVLGTKHNTSKL